MDFLLLALDYLLGIPFLGVIPESKAVLMASNKGTPVILYAYPAAMTPGCTTQACDFRDSLASLTKAGYAVLGISPDPVEKLAEFRERDHLTFPLLSDPDHKVLEKYGAYGEKQLYGKTVVGVIRSTFIIDRKGIIRHAQYGVNPRGHAGEVLERVRALHMKGIRNAHQQELGRHP